MRLLPVKKGRKKIKINMRIISTLTTHNQGSLRQNQVHSKPTTSLIFKKYPQLLEIKKTKFEALK